MHDRHNDIDPTYQHYDTNETLLYHFVSVCSAYMREPRDYGTGEKISMAEVHILTQIDDHPGIIVSQIDSLWGRSRSAASQIVKKLKKKGYIEKKKTAGNDKNVHLFPTSRGHELSEAHKKYDIEVLSEAMEDLRKTCTEEEIAAFYKVAGEYAKLF